MATTLVFETPSITTDNERGVATGWQPGELSDAGRALAAELGARRRNDGIAVTLTSDLGRAVATARIAFHGSSMPILHDWRLRECDYGRRAGMPVSITIFMASTSPTCSMPTSDGSRDGSTRSDNAEERRLPPRLAVVHPLGMRAVAGPDGAGSLSERLRSYEPTVSEAGDVRRIRRLVASGSPWDRAMPLHVTASALVVHPPSRRVLLRWHERQQAWLQIGGHGDPGERDPLAVVLREGREETGLTDLEPWPDAALRHVVVVPVPANDREPAHEHADLRFVLATQRPDAARPERPTATLRWLSIDDALHLTSEENVRETVRRAGRLLAANH